MQRSLLNWIRQPSSRRGIRFGAQNGDWNFWTYDRLADAARRVAQGLIQAGLPDNGIVVIIQNSSPGFIASFFGTLLAGGVPAPMPPPARFRTTEDYWQRARGLLQQSQPAVVVIENNPPTALCHFLQAADCNTITVDTLLRSEAGVADFGRGADELALLQFTSGSSGTCRAVRVPFASLEANVAAIHRWLEWTEADPVASWLPVHHDMGLIGCVISAITCQSDLWLLDPDQFVRSPIRFLRCFGEHGARLSAIPNFGLDHIVRRVKPEMLTGMNFSAWRAVIIGSEPVKPESLESFHNLLAPFGLKRTSLLPAYGLAEATLAVTGLPLSEGWSSLDIDSQSLAPGAPAPGVDHDSLGQTRLVGCGRPLAGVSVSIRSESNQTLPDLQIGQIVVHGDSVAAGYLNDQIAGDTSFRADGLYTGDIGFMQNGQLFVLGRQGDSLKIRGRAVFAEDVEAALSRAGIPAKRVIALLGWHKSEPTAVVLLEPPAANNISVAHSILRTKVSEANHLVFMVPRGTIRRTSSGKPRRRELWRRFCENDFTDKVTL